MLGGHIAQRFLPAVDGHDGACMFWAVLTGNKDEDGSDTFTEREGLWKS